MNRLSGAASLLLLALPLCACKSAREQKPSLASASARPTPIDRLAKDELAPGGSEVFGFEIPRQMRIAHHFKDAVHLVGDVEEDALAKYVKERVTVQLVEAGATRMVFSNARIKGGQPERLYQLEIMPEQFETKLIIRDITPPPMIQGLSEEERWRRAGFTPDGRPIDLKSLE